MSNTILMLAFQAYKDQVKAERKVERRKMELQIWLSRLTDEELAEWVIFADAYDSKLEG